MPSDSHNSFWYGIRRIIHWGLPTTVEEYVQETGHSGRDGESAVALLYKGVGGRKATAKIKACVDNETKCRRRLLFQDFVNNVVIVLKCLLAAFALDPSGNISARERS